MAKPRNGTGYRLLFDYYGHRGEPIAKAVGGTNASKFVQLYGVHKATLESKRMGYSVSRKTLANGTIQLTAHQ